MADDLSSEIAATPMGGLRAALNTTLFDMAHPTGRFFNFSMLALTMFTVLLSMSATVESIRLQWGAQINRFEQAVLMVFAVEYALRIYAARWRWRYIRSFNGIIDLMTVLPLLLTGTSFVLIRLLRLARVIRVAVSIPIVRSLFASLRGSMRLLSGVLMTIALISVLVGNLIHILEPDTFANAFEGTWWSLVTMSTVGYGDFVPHTPAGKALAAMLIMTGICMFAMVTAVISVKVGRMVNNVAHCNACAQRIAEEFRYCPHCGAAQASAHAAETS